MPSTWLLLLVFTITPTFKYQDNYYPRRHGVNTLGLHDSKSWSAGIDATYVINPDTSITVGYMYENYTQLLYGSSSTSNTAVVGVGGVYSAQTNDAPPLILSPPR